MSVRRFVIPKPVTSFVGRDQELASLCARIAPASSPALVTLVGAAGAGKTRLALELANALLEEYAGAVHYVDLSDLPPGASISRAVFERLGLQQYVDAGLEQGIALALEEPRALLILDNCEHVAHSAAQLCDYLLQWVMQAHILCTSREVLGVQSELIFTVAPLPTLPVTENRGELAGDALEPFASNSAVRLFCDRAAVVSPGFVLTRDNVHTIAHLCCLLDGLPLAIELAAAQVRRYTPDVILANLQQYGFGMLAQPNSPTKRHRTLESAIAWSTDLLAPREKILFRRLAVFGGGWTLSAARSVCCDELIPETQLLTIMGNLLDKSLVSAEPIGNGSRCRMLGTIHEQAARMLAGSGEEESIARRHLDWVCEHSKFALAGLTGRDSVATMQELDLEAENYTLAMRRFSDDEPRCVSRIILNISQYWVRRQKLAELMEWTGALLAHSRVAELPVIAARAHYVRGRAYGWMTRFYDAADHFRAAIRLAKQAADPELYDMARVSSLHAISNAGALEEAMANARSLEADNYAPQDPWAIANYALARGLLATARSEYVAALELLNQGVRGLRIVGERYLLTIGLYQVGTAAQLAGNREAALGYLLEACQNASELGFQNLYLRILLRLSEILSTLGRVAEGLTTFERAIALLESVGEQPSAHLVRALASIASDVRQWEVAHFLYAATERLTALEHRMTFTGAQFHRHRIGAARAALESTQATRLAQRAEAMNLSEALTVGLHHLRHPDAGSLQEVTPKMEVHLLGPLRIWVHGMAISESAWRLQKARELLAVLASDIESSREQLELLLWPDADGDQARNRFNVTLHSLRRTLGDPSCVQLAHNRYILAPQGGLATDLAEFRQNVMAARSIAAYDAPQAIAYLQRAVELVRGPLLADIFDGDWHLALRARVQEESVAALVLLGTLHCRQRDFAQAEAAFCRASTLDPLSEEACRGLMHVYGACDNLSRMTRTYHALAMALRNELGVTPSAATTALHDELIVQLDPQRVRYASPK